MIESFGENDRLEQEKHRKQNKGLKQEEKDVLLEGGCGAGS